MYQPVLEKTMTTSHSKVYMWSAIDRITVSVIGLGGNIIFANLLSASDFGLLAMVAIFSALAYNLSSCGLSDGLIQKEHPTGRDYSTVMSFNGAFGLFFCILFVLLSHPLSDYFNQPALVNILCCIGVCFFFQTLTFVQEARMRKELQMKNLCIIHILSSTTSLGLGLYFALNGFGYWALVSTQVFLSFFTFIYTILISRWMPRIAFYKDSFNSMFGYGFNLMLSYILSTISRNISNFALGRNNATSAGLFSQAQKMEEVPFSFTEMTFCNSFFPILSNETDPHRKRELCNNMISFMSLFNISVALLMVLLSTPAFNLLFGHKWDASIPVFRVLVVFGTLFVLKQFFQTMLKAYGYAKPIRDITVCEVILQLVLLYLALPHGIVAVAWSQDISIFIIFGVNVAYFAKISESSFLHMMKLMLTPLVIPVAAFLLAGAGYMFAWTGLNPLSTCILNAIAFCTLCIIGWEIFPHSTYTKYRTLFISKIRVLKQK